VHARGASFRFTAHGGSMYPFIRDGDSITLAPVRTAPRVGDVVAVLHLPSERLLVHRVVERRRGAILVRGDSCRAPDGVFGDREVLGVVARVERRGRPVAIGGGSVGRAVAAASRAGALVPLMGLVRRVLRPHGPSQRPLSPETVAVLRCAQAVLDERRVAEALRVIAACESSDRLILAAAEHGMLGHLEQVVRLHGVEVVPQCMRERLSERQRNTAAYYLIQTGKLLDILESLKSEGIVVMPIKGPAWAERLYGDPVLRSWGDLDLLVPHAQVALAREILLQAGYRDDSPFNERFMHRSSRAEGAVHLTSADSTLHVDIHWQMSPGYGAMALPSELFLARAQSTALLGHRILGPTPADLLLMTCLHGARHRWDSVESLLALGVQIRGVSEAEWPGYLRAARAAGRERALVVGVTHVCRTLGMPMSLAVREALLRDRVGLALFASLPPESLAPFAADTLRRRFAREVWVVGIEDSPWASTTNLAVRVFRPGPEDWESGSWSDANGWVAVALRPVRLVAKWAHRAIQVSGRVS